MAPPESHNMPILATAVTTIECDGHHGIACPNHSVVEFPYPQSVAIRLAKQSGWTVWMESVCPACSTVPAVPEVQAPESPATKTRIQVSLRSAGLLSGHDFRVLASV